MAVALPLRFFSLRLRGGRGAKQDSLLSPRSKLEEKKRGETRDERNAASERKANGEQTERFRAYPT